MALGPGIPVNRSFLLVTGRGTLFSLPAADLPGRLVFVRPDVVARLLLRFQTDTSRCCPDGANGSAFRFAGGDCGDQETTPDRITPVVSSVKGGGLNHGVRSNPGMVGYETSEA